MMCGIHYDHASPMYDRQHGEDELRNLVGELYIGPQLINLQGRNHKTLHHDKKKLTVVQLTDRERETYDKSMQDIYGYQQKLLFGSREHAKAIGREQIANFWRSALNSRGKLYKPPKPTDPKKMWKWKGTQWNSKGKWISKQWRGAVQEYREYPDGPKRNPRWDNYYGEMLRNFGKAYNGVFFTGMEAYAKHYPEKTHITSWFKRFAKPLPSNYYDPEDWSMPQKDRSKDKKEEKDDPEENEEEGEEGFEDEKEGGEEKKEGGEEKKDGGDKKKGKKKKSKK